MKVRELIECLAAADLDATVMYLRPHDDVADADELVSVETSPVHPGVVFVSTGDTNLRYGW
jgi:hypothetical protein